jgi:NADH:ubiquinone oxidoreductase subunit 6 (subunit J)
MGLAYIIVYCGAIAIIFLFVIMMISTSKANLRTSTIPLLLYTTGYLFVEPINEITYSYPLLALIPFTLTDLFQFSLLLYIAYPVALMIVAIALLLVLLGLIHLVIR